MIYHLRNDNFSRFDHFAIHKCEPRAYFIPFKEEQKARNVSLKKERYSSEYVRCLSGEWDFLFVENPQTLPESFDTDKIEFDKVRVPSCWQFTGYAKPFYLNIRYQFKVDPPHIPTVKAEPFRLGVKQFFPTDAYNNVGIYRTFVDIPKDSLTRKIAFLGVCSCLDLYINGNFVGYSEGSHNTAEFAIDKYLVQGKNEIVACVRRWSTGTYLEAQDMFRNNGIFRDVLLYETPQENILDYEIKTKKTNNGYNMTVNVFMENPKDSTVTVKFDLGEKSYSQSARASEKISFFFSDLMVEEWSAEIPNLYTLIISTDNDYYIRAEVGFRDIKIKDAVYYWNGQPIKILGVNHHDTSPTQGYYMTPDEWERDALLMKEFNCNAVRTSHYPPDPLFLQLCQRLGIYVIDEADIETHGMSFGVKGINGISNNLMWKDHYLDRVRRMYMRDKNLSCIAMWSLGNESGGHKCQDYCYQYLHAVTTIPVHYEGACRCRRKAYDIMSEMYTPISFMRRYHAKAIATHGKRYHPYFLCEYAHAMGVGPGSLRDYFNLFHMHNNYLGGCIWEWADHAVLHEDGTYTYGGDHGEYMHDDNFCVDGLFYPDRKPSRSALEMKNVYRPIQATYNGKTVLFKNYRYFSDSSDIIFKISYSSEGRVLKTITKEFSIPPQTTSGFAPELPEEESVEILIRYIDKATLKEVGFDSFVAKNAIQANYIHKKEKQECEPLTINDYGGSIEILCENKYRYVFNKISCSLTTVELNGKNMVNSSPINRHGMIGSYTEFFRAPFDNDVRVKTMWRAQGVDAYVIKPKFIHADKRLNGCYVIYSSFRYKAKRLIATENNRITIHPDGTVVYEVSFVPWGQPFLARIGKVFEWNKELNKCTLFGRGDGESYPDFKDGTFMGEFSYDISQGEPYIYPQHTGTMSDVRWAKISDKTGKYGIKFGALKKPFYWTAKHYTERDIDHWKHRQDVVDLPTSATTIDGYWRGVGSNSCGPLPLFTYTLHGFFFQYHYKFLMKPFDQDNNE